MKGTLKISAKLSQKESKRADIQAVYLVSLPPSRTAQKALLEENLLITRQISSGTHPIVPERFYEGRKTFTGFLIIILIYWLILAFLLCVVQY